jgi:hypothetical protein
MAATITPAPIAASPQLKSLEGDETLGELLTGPD